MSIIQRSTLWSTRMKNAILRESMPKVGWPIRKQEIPYALCHIPVQPGLANKTSTPLALLVLLHAPAVRHTRLACQTRQCQGYKVSLVLVRQVLVVKAIDAVMSRALWFQSFSDFQWKTMVCFQLAVQQRGYASKITCKTTKLVAEAKKNLGSVTWVRCCNLGIASLAFVDMHSPACMKWPK